MKNGAKSSLVTLDHADLELRITSHIISGVEANPLINTARTSGTISNVRVPTHEELLASFRRMATLGNECESAIRHEVHRRANEEFLNEFVANQRPLL